MIRDRVAKAFSAWLPARVLIWAVVRAGLRCVPYGTDGERLEKVRNLTAAELIRGLDKELQ